LTDDERRSDNNRSPRRRVQPTPPPPPPIQWSLSPTARQSLCLSGFVPPPTRPPDYCVEILCPHCFNAEKSRKVDERAAAAGERNYNGAKPQQTIRGRRAERTRGSRSLPVFPLLGD